MEAPKGGFEPQWDTFRGILYSFAVPFITALRELFEETGILLWKRRTVRQLVYNVHPYTPQGAWNATRKNNYLFMTYITDEELACRKADLPWLGYDPVFPTNVYDFKYNYQRPIITMYRKLTGKSPSEAFKLEDDVSSFAYVHNW